MRRVHTQTVPIRSAFLAVPHSSLQQTASPHVANARESPAPANPCPCRFRLESALSNRWTPLDPQFQKRAASVPSGQSSPQTDLRQATAAAAHRSPAPARPASTNSLRADAIHRVQILSRDNPPLPFAALPLRFLPHPGRTPSAPACNFPDRAMILGKKARPRRAELRPVRSSPVSRSEKP